MIEIKGMAESNLDSAHCDESMACKSPIYGALAESEWKSKMARLFWAFPWPKGAGHQPVLGAWASSSGIHNLQVPIDGDTYEIDEMYPA